MLIMKNRTDWKRNSYTKTEDGKRIVALDDDTVKILNDWKSRQTEIGLGKERDFVFSYDGLPMIKSTISRIIERYSKFAEVKKIQAKGLRHSHASYLINEFNVSVLVLSQRMGHSSPEITLKHYAHMWSGADTAIAEEMSGNIKIETAEYTKITFNGNQVIKKRRDK
ncbi:tyrosine-type recombinase/integrase, partial [Bacillus paranthracis]|nr:tyrosine-type recombinase/integrase [Bacillus paranthracis]